FQPMAADDVAAALARIATSSPAKGITEIGGPEKFRLDELARRTLKALHDARDVISDPQAPYYGIQVNETTLLPADNAQLGETRFEDWLSRTTKETAKSALQPA
ncbi:MAG TPA: NmrA family transcriptional regulator, partial [Bryobacteraceae bacterium]